MHWPGRAVDMVEFVDTRTAAPRGAFMEKRVVPTPGIGGPKSPYSLAVAAGDLLFISGQVPMKPDGTAVKGDFEAEARQALDNVKAVLEAAGSGLPHVVKVLVFLSDMDKFGAFNEIYKEYFMEERPARSCIQAGRLPFDFQVEVECVAVLPRR